MTLPRSWVPLLVSLASTGAAPTTLVFEHPEVIAAVVKPQHGSLRPELPVTVQAAVLRLVAQYPRGYSVEMGGHAKDLLAAAATFAGIAAPLRTRLARSNHFEVRHAIIRNPQAPPSLLRSAVRADYEMANCVFQNPATHPKLRLGILRAHPLGTHATIFDPEGVLPLADTVLDEMIATVLAPMFDDDGDVVHSRANQNACILVSTVAHRRDFATYRAVLRQAITTRRLRGDASWLPPVLPYHFVAAMSSADLTSEDIRRILDAFEAALPSDDSSPPASVTEYIARLDSSSAELISLTTDASRTLRAAALARADLDEAAVVAHLVASVSECPSALWGEILGRLSPDSLAALITGLGASDHASAFEYLSATLEHASSQVGVDVARAYLTRVIIEGPLAKIAASERAVRALVGFHGAAVYAEVVPSALVRSLTIHPARLATWLVDQVGVDGVEMFLSLGPTWEASSGELVATIRALADPA